MILENRDLVIAIAQSRETSFTQDEFADAIRQLDTLTDVELVQINRLFLGLAYKDLCPQFVDVTSGIAEALPLASLIVGGNEGIPQTEKNKDSDRSVIKATSSANYDSNYSAIKETYRKYTTVWETALPPFFSKGGSIITEAKAGQAYAQILATIGDANALNISYSNPYLIGTATSTLDYRVWAAEGIGLGIPIIGWFGLSWEQDIVARNTRLLDKWEVFRKKI